MRKAAAALAGVALLTLSSTADAHNASVECDSLTGKFVITTDFNNLNPISTFGPTTVTVRWSDGFKVVRDLPTDCSPETPPVPPTPELEPPVPPAPPVAPEPPIVPAPPAVFTCQDYNRLYPKAGLARRIAWGCAKPPLKTKRTIYYHGFICQPGDKRSARSRTTIVTWSRGGEVVKTKQFTKRLPGVICRLPEVAG